ncbi:DUF1918 domain-containing protein [Mycobacterium uberis]|uniref:DUF1918 domain-containing protein n=1 Tax=Mycobacterium uberis TaxID=2162698 RepID=UPI001FB4D90E|nr:DUF1918 domain-containing protein [Mycobacterium uberis]
MTGPATKGTKIGRPDQLGLITKVHAPDCTLLYAVRWLATEHELTFVPGVDTTVD